MYASYNFQLVMSHPAMSLGLRFCTSRKGGTGGGGQVSPLGPGNMAASGLSYRKPLIGQDWVGHSSPPLHECMGLEHPYRVRK